MGTSSVEVRLEAVERYLSNSRRAEYADYWARLTGQNFSLLKYEVVANRLHIRQQIPVGHQMVMLHHIVGSVGRYREFNRDFLPRPVVMQDRWVAVDVTMNSLQGVPPVDLYKIGEAYFAIDGNHRVSVARANGNKDIEANVIECQTNVALTVEDFVSDRWLVKAAYSDFLAQTQLNQLRPQVALEVSDADHYQALLQHISVHRYLSNQSHRGAHWQGEALSWHDAVVSWVERVYLPIVEAIQARGLLARFPKRTVTDLYLLVTQFRERVAEQYGLAPLSAESAVAVFAANHAERILDRLRLTLRQRAVYTFGLGGATRPAGMSHEEFESLRLRHDAGELGVAEAKHKATRDKHFLDPRCEAEFSVQFSG